MSSLLEIENLTVSFPAEEQDNIVVNDVSFSMEKGQTTVLVGESGSGKSMTAMAIMRLLPTAANISSGSISLHDQNIFAFSETDMKMIRGKKIGMIFQEPQNSLNPVMTCGQQIGEVIDQHQSLSKEQKQKRIIELLDSVGIPDPETRLNDYPHQYSGGMKQRVMIAMALACEPDLLIADEPTTALDVTIQAQVLELLKELQQKTGMGILFITHDLAVANQIADQMVVMYQGKIVEKSDSKQFFQGPQHEYSMHLFNSLPTKAKRDAEQREVISKDKAAILEVSDLKVHFPIRKGIFKRTVGHIKAVDGVSIKIRAGETVAIVGESGSGKTTMGKGILQLIKPTAGSAKYHDEELTILNKSALRKKRTDLQIVFQDPYSSMNPRMMIKDILEEGMLVHNIGKDSADRLNRIQSLMEHVELDKEYIYRYPHEFSGGQRQRVCIARALAVEPQIIVCDEPTSALDVSVQSQILDLLRDLQKRLDLAYLFITHNISVVEYLADYVAVMYKGKIVEQGTVEQIMYDPQHEYTQQLLSAVPKIDLKFA